MSNLMPTDVCQYNCYEDYKNNLQATCFYVNLTRRKNPLSVYFLYLKSLMEYPPEHKVRSHHPLNHGRIYKEHYIQLSSNFVSEIIKTSMLRATYFLLNLCSNVQK